MNAPQAKKLQDLQFTVIRRAVGYARVSTDDQADYGTSLESQKLAIYEYAARNDIEIVDCFEDDYSGRKLDRPGFNRVRKYLREGLVNCLIVYNANRLSRHRTHTMMIVDELQSLGSELHLTTKGQVDLTDDTAVLVLSIDAHMAHKEVNEIVERTKRGKRTKASKGQIMAALPPYSFKIHKQSHQNENGRIIVTDRKLVIDPIPSEIVKMIYELFAYKDYSYNAIARHLNSEGYRYSKAQKWTAYHISQIIPNTVYKGEYNYAGIITQVEAIVSSELWQLAQDKRLHNRKHKRWNSPRYLLSGRTKCFHCGYHIAGTLGGKDRPCYRCTCAYATSEYYKLNNITCENRHYFPANKVEAVVLDWLHKILTDKEVLKQGLENYVAFQMTKYQPLLDDLERVEKELARKKVAKEKLLDAYLDGVFDKETIQLRKLHLEEDIKSAISAKAELEQQLSEISRLPQQVKDIEQLGEVVTKAFKRGIPSEKGRELVELLDVKCKLEYSEEGLFVHATSILDGRLLGPLWRTFYNSLIHKGR